MKKLFSCIAILALLAMSSTSMAQDAKGGRPTAASLPNGATSLTETYGLWTVNCAVVNGEKGCAMIRQEVNAQNQPVLSINITSEENGNVTGIMLVPFGILVTRPIHLQVDDTNVTLDTNVRTCVPTGCVVPVTFNTNVVAGLRAGKQLKLAATSSGPGEPAVNNLFIQLSGFSGALDRLKALKG
ncbi:invasion associated locus B family protein [Bartonella tamiae]|uniref:Invasion protein B n=1 Tax=Bartonella tamiae Th239 TaxID=1094558 RepID=J0R464_9HYPH|nr:invasion associated locus B family protein [Bartonella tamiae]EJF90404.1 hypothetical protein ME5_00805 [Bartonella tamiae Th239]EJF93652.1 hypothetical protein MEG_01076 [Bartonella tamiae Th307]